MRATEETNELPLPPLLESLLRWNHISAGQARAVWSDHLTRGELIVELLSRKFQIPESAIAESLAQISGVPFLPANEIPSSVSEEVLGLLPDTFLQINSVLPILLLEGKLVVAAADPTDATLFEEIRVLAGYPVQPVVSTRQAILSAIRLLTKNDPSLAESGAPDPSLSGELSGQTDVDASLPVLRDTEVHRAVNRLLRTAAEERASDIHIEPAARGFVIKLRVDGRLQEYSAADIADIQPVVSRLKIIAQMDISEKRIPQDGACSITTKGNRIDLRVSTVPTVLGEKMVLRLLDKSRVPLDIDRLGFSEDQRRKLVDSVESPHGLIFVTGPTGSGKSTTLYSCLERVKSPEKNILTVEDPVEFKITGITQVQVRPTVGLTFSTALRAFLRQDPDLIMVGEVRDKETAEICLRASTTGHLVLSTLHTTNALAVVPRLVDMQVDRFLLAATLRLVEAQRLLRRLCVKCRTEYQPERATCDRFSIDPNRSLFKARGCTSCRGSGYLGRLGVYEVIPITPDLRQLIETGAPLTELQRTAKGGGAQLLWDSGVGQVVEGNTTLEELLAFVSYEEAT